MIVAIIILRNFKNQSFSAAGIEAFIAMFGCRCGHFVVLISSRDIGIT
jgi:hypothetical protein